MQAKKEMRNSILLILMLIAFDVSASCRSASVKREFDRQQGYPHGRPGWVVDHICALACGGKDSTINMQYQPLWESKEKDKWEATKSGCARTCTPLNSTLTRQVYNCK